MSSTNLFGQYYNNLGKNKTYTNVNYNCSSSTSGENSLVFKDGEAQLLDSNGNIVGKIDLSNINAGPMTSWASSTIVINPGEVKLIEGLEYGKLYKHVYFEVPNIYIDKLGDAWKYLVNTKFTILLNVDLDLREYEVSTTTSTEDQVVIEDRIQKLIDEVGAEDNIKFSIQEIEDEFGNTKTYAVFESLVLGYDFIITEFSFFNHRIIYSDTKEFIEDTSIPEEIQEEIETHENEIEFSDGTTYNDSRVEIDEEGEYVLHGTEVGHYDGEDNPEDPLSASHYYVGEVETQEGEESGDEDNPQDLDPTETEDDSDGIEDDNHEDPEESISDDDTIMTKQEFYVERDKDLEIHAFKYPNGAARAWFVVPEWPSSIDEQYVSLKLAHVKDTVNIFDINEDCECDQPCFAIKTVDVFASERNEQERHNLKALKYFLGDNFTYMDSVNGSIVEVHHDKDFCNCPDLTLEIHNPHIGMYRYLDYVEMNDLWTNVGSFYGLVTNADTDDIDIKNLANSIFLYNKNNFPVKVTYFICV